MGFGKKYDPSFEQDIYRSWQAHGVFKPDGNMPAQSTDGKKRETFVTMLPPPNVTGNLHLGHSVMCAIQDVMVRYNRMQQKETVWVPGTDHASISTQVVVEKMLKEQGIDKETLGREKFLAKVWERVGQTRSTITNQIRAMGASIDREREQFTMSERLSRSVRHAFKVLYDQGKIYQSMYMVNRSPGAQTVLSDLEVENKTVTTKMYHVRYFIQGKGDSITVATIRPETIFADVAIAVHPKDRRYKKFIGKNALIPIINRPIPVIADESVQIEFGTGALKITPTHSEADYEIAKNHDLPMDFYALDKNNIFTEQAGEDFAGKDAYEFMENLVFHLQEIGNIDKVEDYETTIPVCERTGVVVQPLLSQQWFMGVKKPAERVTESIQNDEVHIHPERFKKIFLSRLEEIRPWCISRQLRRGHRIPVWYSEDGTKYCFDEDNVVEQSSGKYSILSMIVFNLIADSRLENPFSLEALIDVLTQQSITRNEGRVIDVYCKIYAEKYKDSKDLLKEIALLQSYFAIDGSPNQLEKDASGLVAMLDDVMNLSNENQDTYTFQFYADGKQTALTQDDDVLDTWFSSALWPFSTLGRPENTEDFQRYYPNSILETGYDIIFFRVIRMMLLGVEMVDALPFKHVYLHGLVRAEDGSKMSKSKGNGVDPMKIIEQYGADSLRGSLLLGNTPGNDQKFSLQKVDYVSRFINKLWNASRFAASRHYGSVETITSTSFEDLEKSIIKSIDKMNEYDIWMLDTLNQTVQFVTRYNDKFMLGEALQDTITLLWHQFCDWYIEIVKVAPSPVSNMVMMYVLGVSYKLLHPSLPFTSEKLWSHLGFTGMIAVAPWPNEIQLDEKNYRINLLMDLISQWRTLKTEIIEKPHEKVSIFVKSNKDIHALVEHHATLIKSIVNVEQLDYIDEHQESPDGYNIGMLMDITLGVKGLRERNPREILLELEGQIKEEEEFLQRLRVTLTTPGFADKAPAHVVEEKKQKMQEVKTKIASIQFEMNKIKMSLS